MKKETDKSCEPSSEVNNKKRYMLIACIIACLLAIALVGYVAFITGSNSAGNQQSLQTVQNQDVRASDSAAEDICEHDWTLTYKTVHHDAVTHTESVAPKYASQTSYHTICNECKQVIDGIADEHIKATGHSGYTTNVPITDEVLVSEGYSYEVTDIAAWDETVPDTVVCTKCGELQAIGETS